jgi:hypothetical protein
MEINLLNNPKCIYPRNKKNFPKTIFEFVFESPELKTKRSNTSSHVCDFQKKLAEEMLVKNRRTYKNDVAVIIDIFIKQVNAPQIHSIAKNYIDLICETKPDPETKPDSEIFRRHLILNDDLQIKYLSVSYNESNEETSVIKFKVFSYHIFKERIHLVKWFNTYSHQEPNGIDEYIHDDSMSEYQAQEALDNDSLESKYWKLWHQRNAQITYLHNNRIKNKSIADIFYPKSPSQNNLNKFLIDDLDNSKYNNFDDIILQLNLDYFQFNFGPLPKEGERKSYEKTIKDQVKNYLKERAFLNPPLTSFGITILVKKVVTSKKDLDNIAKEIIEAIGEFLNPPTDQLNSLQNEEIQFMNQRYEIDFTKNKKFPNVGFIGYQVLYLPTSPNEIDEFVRLNIHGFKHGLSNCETFPDYIDGRFNEISKYGQFR